MAPISLLNVIRQGGFDASIITTYNATLPFYEEVVLRRLVAAGCRQNIVLMDRRQCAMSWQSPAARPRRAGSDYSLLPVTAPAAFHPKVCLLVGKRKAAVLVGSHNLTLSGYAYNREITNWIQVEDQGDAEGVALVAKAWYLLQAWIDGERQRVPAVLFDAVRSVANVCDAWTRSLDGSGTSTLLAQSVGTRALIDQIDELVSAHVVRIVVTGAFFDRELAFLTELERRWPDAQIIVAIDPQSVHLPGKQHGRARFVDARMVWPTESSGGGYLHAKLVYFEAASVADDVLVSGSANPSEPGWLGGPNHGNIEAVLARAGSAARNAALMLGLDQMRDLPALDATALDAVVLRSLAISEEAVDEAVPKLLVGSADTEGKFSIPCSAALKVDRAELLGADDDVIGVQHNPPCVEGMLRVARPPNAATDIRSCVLYWQNQPVARAMIGYPALLGTAPKTPARDLRDALVLTEISGEAIERLLAVVEDAVFNSAAEQEVEDVLRVRRAAQHQAKSNERPASLELAVSTTGIAILRRHHLVMSTDIGTVIDVLSRAVQTGLAAGAGAEERSEEEQVGTDDPDDDSTADQPGMAEAGAVDDLQLAQRVAGKVRRLIGTIVAKVAAANDANKKGCALIQLLAVLTVLRELMRIEQLPRWRMARAVLVTRNDRQYLLDKLVVLLFGGKRQLMKTIPGVDKGESDEAVRLRGLLLWLAWSVDLPVPGAAFNPFSALDQPDALRGMVLFLELSRRMAADPNAQRDLREHISVTQRRRPEAAAQSEAWVQSMLTFGRHWAGELREAPRARAGGCCWVGDCTEPRLIVHASNGIIGLWDEPQPYRVAESWVLAIQPGLPESVGG